MMAELVIRDEAGRQRAIDLIRAANLAKPWAFSWKPWKAKRSLSQNALYHKWAGIIADETGNDHETIHEYLKKRFLAPVLVNIGDNTFLRRTTTKLSTKEMSEYMEKVYAFAAGDLGIALPTPELMHLEAA